MSMEPPTVWRRAEVEHGSLMERMTVLISCIPYFFNHEDLNSISNLNIHPAKSSSMRDADQKAVLGTDHTGTKFEFAIPHWLGISMLNSSRLFVIHCMGVQRKAPVCVSASTVLSLYDPAEITASYPEHWYRHAFH